MYVVEIKKKEKSDIIYSIDVDLLKTIIKSFAELVLDL